MATNVQELTVRSESVQRLYGLYVSDRFEVNRRYQRKLVWSVEEKQKLVDSMLRDLPLPLFLVAEVDKDAATYELIDGLQRLNAIFAFLENEYPIEGAFFDLDSLADTKLRKDKGSLTQRLPVLSREKSTAFVNYNVALSVFRAADESSVEEIFRRINSGGRRLSRQSLRQAGTISPLADLVRVLSSRVRGDTSPSESVPLQRMPQLSITNYNLDYGVNVDEIFWVKNGILRREDVRESLDEQLVLDMLIDCLIQPLRTTGTRIRDDFYSYGDYDEPTRDSISMGRTIETVGQDRSEASFMRIYDEVRSVLTAADKKFSVLVGAGSGGRAPRYFHGVFIAFYELIYGDRLRVRDYAAAAKALEGIGAGGALTVPGGGGDWSGDTKRSTIDAVKGVLRSSFEGPIEGDDLGSFGYASQLETILGNSLVEQQLFDCKQGLFTLGGQRVFDQSNFKKIARTLSAMANSGKQSVGYIALGIADSDPDAQKIRELDGVDPVLYRGFRVVGIDREALLHGTDLSEYWHWLIQKFAASGLDPSIAKGVTSSARLVSYRNHAVGLLKVVAPAAPNFFDGEIYERSGSDTKLVPKEEYVRIFQGF